MPNFLDMNPKYLRHSAKIKRYMGEPKVTFSPTNQEHTDLIDDCLHQYKLKFSQLESNDRQILWSSVISLGCFLLSTVSTIFTSVAIGSLAHAVFRIGQREQKEKEYRQALENLVNCTNWAIGSVQDKDQDPICDCQSIKNLVDAIAKVTEEAQRRKIIDDSLRVDVKSKSVSSRNDRDRNFDKHMEQAYLKLYGYRQGKVEDALYSIFQAFRNWLSAVFASPPTYTLSSNGREEDELGFVEEEGSELDFSMA